MTVKRAHTSPSSWEQISGIQRTHVPSTQHDANSSEIHESIRLAEIALQQGNAVEAVQRYTAAIDCYRALPQNHPLAAMRSGRLRWLHAHRGDAWARIGGWDEAELDFKQATTTVEGEAKDYDWAWAHWAEMLRLKARDDEETREDPKLFLGAILRAVTNFDRAIELHQTKASQSPEAQSSRTSRAEADSPSDGMRTYPWAYAHRAATGVLCWLYYVEETTDNGLPEEQRIPEELRRAYMGTETIETRGKFFEQVDRDFNSAHGASANDPWRDQFEALWLLLTSDKGKDRSERADALAGRALLSGASSFALEAGMVFAALFAFSDRLEDGAESLKTTALQRANDLLKKDPTHAIGHATLAAVYRKYAGEQSGSKLLAFKRAYESSVEVLKMNRDLLDEIIKAVDSAEDAESRPAARSSEWRPTVAARRTGEDRAMAPQASIVETQSGMTGKKRRRGFETSFIAKRLHGVANKRATSD